MNSKLVVFQNRDLAALSGPVVPLLVSASGGDAVDRFLNFFATQIENDNTREAYLRAARVFLAWCERHELARRAAGYSANPCCGLDQGSEGDACGADGQAASGSHPPPVRLAGDRPRAPSCAFSDELIITQTVCAICAESHDTPTL
jgi:hypothetical protein